MLFLMEAKDVAKKEVADIMARCYARCLTTATGGNVSMRFGSVMLITPSSLDKASLTPDKIAEVDLATGENLTPALRLSIESGMHRSIYLAHGEVNAVVHAHPTFASFFSASTRAINTRLIAESYYLLGKEVKVAPYALMGSGELATIIAREIGTDSAILLSHHGALCVGKTLLSAFDRMEVLEQSAKMTFLSRSVEATDLDNEQCAVIAAMK